MQQLFGQLNIHLTVFGNTKKPQAEENWYFIHLDVSRPDCLFFGVLSCYWNQTS